MRILTRYYIVRFLGLFAMTFVAGLLILATIEMVLNLDDLSSFGPGREAADGTAGALRYLAIRIVADYLTELLPITSFLAMFLTFAWAGRNLELVVLQGGGIRVLRVLTPVLCVALILSLGAALAHETIVLEARRIWAQETRGDRDALKMNLDQRSDRRAFWHHRGRTITNIAYADPVTRSLHHVEIFERGPTGRVSRVIRAERVLIGEDGSWALENAGAWRFDAESDSKPPDFEFKASMHLDLETLGGDALLGAEPRVLSLAELADYVSSHREQNTSRLRQVQVRFHERLSGPWLVFAFSLLALPFALAVGASGRFAKPAAAALCALGAFFLLRSAGATLAQEGLVPAAWAPWIPLALVLIASPLALRHVLKP
ncbi:MAG: LptF/LptG family permease [Myxococcota bacterium]